MIQGSGPIGILAVAAAQEMGAGRVICVGAPETPRLALARKFGAEATVNIEDVKTPEERIKKVRDIVGGFGADLVMDCSGHPSAGPEGIEMLRDGGTYVEMGQFTDAGSIQTSWHRICTKDLNVLGSWGFTGNDLPLGVDMLYRTHAKYPRLEMRTLRIRFPKKGSTVPWPDAMAMKIGREIDHRARGRTGGELALRRAGASLEEVGTSESRCRFFEAVSWAVFDLVFAGPAVAHSDYPVAAGSDRWSASGPGAAADLSRPGCWRSGCPGPWASRLVVEKQARRREHRWRRTRSRAARRTAGYTLFIIWGLVANVINGVMQPNLAFDFEGLRSQSSYGHASPNPRGASLNRHEQCEGTRCRFAEGQNPNRCFFGSSGSAHRRPRANCST